ncbi:hypothetical protein NGB36_12180 [Streptomyces sp. RB6PN25]|uniref:Uncharacterized protein n=1 Tax=Streptomyces humicola TaxID=2953240 RepID=A0ABT1PXR8_9ACTN|nr:hypothetical protein [Streptomyces humicola]MCQ4081335.1 hypothetical protein [Streptomyces humicola]
MAEPSFCSWMSAFSSPVRQRVEALLTLEASPTTTADGEAEAEAEEAAEAAERDGVARGPLPLPTLLLPPA